MKVLITGGRGFIGRNLVAGLGDSLELLAPTSAELDLLDGAAVERYLKRHQVEVVIHAAIHDATRNSSRDTSRVLQHNLRMFFHLARCEQHYRRLIYFGSGAEYHKGRALRLVAEQQLGSQLPTDDYGLSKYLMQLHAAGTPKFLNLRLFGVFGPHEDWEIRFISNACCKALHDLPITIRQNVRFDYMHVSDLVRLTRWFLHHRPRHSHYNVCTADPVELRTLAREVLAAAGKQLPITIARPGLGHEYTGDNSRLLAELGPHAFTPRREAVAGLYAWYQQRKNDIPRELLLTDK